MDSTGRAARLARIRPPTRCAAKRCKCEPPKALRRGTPQDDASLQPHHFQALSTFTRHRTLLQHLIASGTASPASLAPVIDELRCAPFGLQFAWMRCGARLHAWGMLAHADPLQVCIGQSLDSCMHSCQLHALAHCCKPNPTTTLAHHHPQPTGN